MRLLCATLMAFSISVSGAGGFDEDVRSVSCLACQRQFRTEEISVHMVLRPRVWESVRQNSFLD